MTFRFRQPMYMFMEDVGTGTVCVDKIGESDRTITVTVTGGKYKNYFLISSLNVEIIICDRI